eukprot:4048924-Pyramimonas_sp.AAC.1
MSRSTYGGKRGRLESTARGKEEDGAGDGIAGGGLRTEKTLYRTYWDMYTRLCKAYWDMYKGLFRTYWDMYTGSTGPTGTCFKGLYGIYYYYYYCYCYCYY